MSNNSIKKCSKCNVEHDQNLGSVCSIEVWKQCRIFTKNGKHFCFSCLASEYNINCQYCHKRINSKDEVAYWAGGILSINGDYDYCKADDRVFTCWGCDEKIREKVKNGVKPSWHSGWGPILFPEHHIRKCRIAGCSQKPYYECIDLCLPHSKPCKGGKIKRDGKRCSAAMGTDEGDICEFCQNQIETYQQQKDRLENESNQEFEKYCRFQKKAQNWWNSLSSSQRERECERLVENMKLGKYWANNVREGEGSAWACDGSYWEIKNGKFVSSSPHLVPIQITEEFLRREFGSEETALIIRKRNDGDITIKPDNNNFPSSIQDAPAPQSITNSNGKNDNSVSSTNSPQPSHGQEKLPESKNIKLVKGESSSEKVLANPASEKSPHKTDNETLIINLKSVKKITLSEGNLIIEFDNKPEGNSQTITLDQINNNQELQKVKNYLEKNNQTSLSQRELDNIFSKNNNDSVSQPKNLKDNNSLLIGGIVGTLIIGIGVGLFLKRKRSRKKR